MAVTATSLGGTGATGTGTSKTHTCSASVPAGTRPFVVVAGWSSANRSASAVSIGGVSLTKDTTLANSGNHHVSVWSAHSASAITGPPTVTVTFDGSISDGFNISAGYLSSVATSSATDGTTGTIRNTGMTSSYASGSITTTNATDGLLGIAWIDGSGGGKVGVPDSPWTTVVDDVEVVGSDWKLSVLFRAVASTGSYSNTGTWQLADTSPATPDFGDAAVIVAYKEAGGAAASVTAVVADSVGSAPIAAISAGVTVGAVPAASVGSTPAASISTAAPVTVTGVVAASAGAAPVATLAAGATVTAAVADSVGSAPPANQIISTVINAPATVSLGSAPPAAVSAGGSGASVTGVPASSAGTAPAASLAAGTSVTGVIADSTGSAPAASLAQGATVTGVVADSTGEVPRPTITPAPIGGAGSAQIAAMFAEDSA